MLSDVWIALDGLKLYIEQSPKGSIQSRFYNGWTHDHYVTNLLGFTPAGTISVACMNVPGSIHDSTVAEWGEVYDKLEKVYEKNGGKCAVDSAFCKKDRDYLIKSGVMMTGTAHEVLVQADATSMRQSAEWGMRSFQASFPRVKDRFIYEENGERGLILKLFVFLFNYRSNKVGINQIKNTYLTSLQLEGNVFVN